MRSLMVTWLVVLAGCACKRPMTVEQPSPTPVVTPSPTPSPVMLEPDAGPPPVDPAALRASCCQQCLNGAASDTSGQDVMISPCTRYLGVQANGQNVLDDACGEFFSENAELSAGECRGDPVEP